MNYNKNTGKLWIFLIFFIFMSQSLFGAFTIKKEGDTDKWVTRGTRIYFSGDFPDLDGTPCSAVVGVASFATMRSFISYESSDGLSAQNASISEESSTLTIKSNGEIAGYIELGSVAHDSVFIVLRSTLGGQSYTSTNYLRVDGVAPSNISVISPSTNNRINELYNCLFSDNEVSPNSDVARVRLEVKKNSESTWYLIPNSAFYPETDVWIPGSITEYIIIFRKQQQLF